MSNKPKRSLIQVQGTSIAVLSHDRQDFICLTDIAKLKNPNHSDDVIRNWLRSRSTVEFLGVWERLNNPSFNPVEFDGIRIQTGLNSFVLTPKQWIEKTGAVGLRSSAGRYGGTYAHSRKANARTASRKRTSPRSSTPTNSERKKTAIPNASRWSASPRKATT